MEPPVNSIGFAFGQETFDQISVPHLHTAFRSFVKNLASGGVASAGAFLPKDLRPPFQEESVVPRQKDFAAAVAFGMVDSSSPAEVGASGKDLPPGFQATPAEAPQLSAPITDPGFHNSASPGSSKG